MIELVKQLHECEQSYLSPPDNTRDEVTDKEALEYVCDVMSVEDAKSAAWDYFEDMGWEVLAKWMVNNDRWGERVSDWKEK